MPRVGKQHFPYTEAGYAAAARAKKSRGYSNGGRVGMNNPFVQIPPFTPTPMRRTPPPLPPGAGRIPAGSRSWNWNKGPPVMTQPVMAQAPIPPMFIPPPPIPDRQDPLTPIARQIAPEEKTDTERKVDMIWSKLFADNKPKDKSDLGYKPNRPKAPINKKDPRFTVTGGPGFGIPGFNEGGAAELPITQHPRFNEWLNRGGGQFEDWLETQQQGAQNSRFNTTVTQEEGDAARGGTYYGTRQGETTTYDNDPPPVNPLYAQALADGADINGDGTISDTELGAWRPSDARYGVGHGGKHLNADNVAWLRDTQGVSVTDGAISPEAFRAWATEKDRHGTGINREAWDEGADIDSSGVLSAAELGGWRPSDARYGVGHGGRHFNADDVAFLRDNQGVPVQADGSIAEADFIKWAAENDRHGTGVNRAAWDAGADTDKSGLLSAEELYSWKPPTYQEEPPPPPPPIYQGPPATAQTTTMQNPYVFGGYGAPPSMPYAGMATPQIPSIMGMAPQAYYGGSAQVGMADPTQRVS